MQLPAGVTLVADPDMVVAVISAAPTAEELEGETEEAAEAEAAEGEEAAEESADGEAPAEAKADA